MTDTVTVRVLPGKSLTLPDGRIISEGEEIDLPAHDAAFAIQMGAARTPEPSAKKGKTTPKTQD